MIITDEYTIEKLKPFLSDDMQARAVCPFDVEADELVTHAAHSSEEDAEGITSALKIGVEHSADSHEDLAFELANTIIRIGQMRENDSFVGLGMMAEGDTLAHSGRIIEAWERLEQAGRIYRQAGDEIGWARTRIGRLWISPELSRKAAEEAFDGAREAEAIFLKAARSDRLLRLYHSWATAHLMIGEYELAIALFQKAVEILKQDDDPHTSEINIAILYSDIGYAYNNLGDLQTAMTYLTHARKVLLDAGYAGLAAMADYAIANNDIMRGHYRSALHLLLHTAIPHLSKMRVDSARLAVADCYLALNRNVDAYEIARDVFQAIETDPDRMYQAGISTLLLATAYSRLGYWSEARQSLDQARTKFKDYESMMVLIQLREGQIALRQGDCIEARRVAESTAAQFHRWQQPMNWIDATLLGAEAALMDNDLSEAQRLSSQALQYARQHDLPMACYQSYVVLGQVLERRGRQHSSIRIYQAALSVLHHIKRSLTMSLRGGFLEDKLLPFHRLMTLYLTGTQIKNAFYTLEQLKSQVLLDYLTQRELFQWPETAQARPLLDQLSRLRDKYRWLSRLQSWPPIEQVEANAWYQEGLASTTLQQALEECRKSIRAVVEQLYLFSNGEPLFSMNTPDLVAVQQSLSDKTILLEFYADSSQIWCLTITREHAAAFPLDATNEDIKRLVDKWRSNLDFALLLNPSDEKSRLLTTKARSIGEQLYKLLLEPIASEIMGKQQLVIVPFGLLHQIPFNMLRREDHYLIETHEIITLPSASLLVRPQVKRPTGTVVAAYSWEGTLQHSISEGEMVCEMMDGTLFPEQATQRDVLQRAPQKILHISTHGEHHLDQPDFGYIELGDGPVYMDDLLQWDLSYELVVLSACEVGRPHVMAGDEVIGPGWSFLYAGAGSLVTSLWRVNEVSTFQLMQSFYQALKQGLSRAAALRAAQCAFLSQHPDFHPAFWAAFQLIGQFGPLTADSDR
jgi:CHAT domain-containing protein